MRISRAVGTFAAAAMLALAGAGAAQACAPALHARPAAHRLDHRAEHRPDRRADHRLDHRADRRPEHRADHRADQRGTAVEREHRLHREHRDHLLNARHHRGLHRGWGRRPVPRHHHVALPMHHRTPGHRR